MQALIRTLNFMAMLIVLAINLPSQCLAAPPTSTTSFDAASIDPTSILTGGLMQSTVPATSPAPSASNTLQERLAKLTSELQELQKLAGQGQTPQDNAATAAPSDSLAAVIAPLQAPEGPITYFLNGMSRTITAVEDALSSATEAILAKWAQRHRLLHVWHDPEAHHHFTQSVIQTLWIVGAIILLNLGLHGLLTKLWRLHSTPEKRQQRTHRLVLAFYMLVRDLIPPLISFGFALVVFHFVSLEHHTKVVVLALLITVAAIKLIPHGVSICLSALTATHRQWLTILGQALSRLAITLAIVHCCDEIVRVLLEIPPVIPFDHLYALLITYSLIDYILTCRHDVAVNLIETLRHRTQSDHKIFETTTTLVAAWHWPAIMLVGIGYILFLLEEGYARMLRPIAGLVVIILSIVAMRQMRHLWNWVAQTMNRSEARTLFLTTYHRSITRFSQAAIAAMAGLIASELWGFEIGAMIHQSPLLSGAVVRTLSIGVILVVSLALIRTGTRFITRFMQRYDEAQHTHSPRIRSLAAILRHTLIWLVSVPAFLLIMAELGFNTTPILASLSIGSLGLGLASQNIFKDVFAGLSIILENTMSVGDIVILEGQRGQVEEITMRYVRLRSDDGALHTFPLSAIEYITNCSRDYAYAMINLSFRHEDNLATIYGVLNTSLDQLRATHPYDRLILEPLDIRGVDVMDELTMQVQVRIKSVPGQQWTVRRAFLTQIKDSLLAAGLQPPISEHAVYLMAAPEIKFASSAKNTSPS